MIFADLNINMPSSSLPPLAPATEPYLIAFGLGDSDDATARAAAAKYSVELSSASNIEELLQSVERRGSQPVAMLLPQDVSPQHVAQLQMHALLREVPTIAICQQIDDDSFEHAFRRGIDDCCSNDLAGLSGLVAAMRHRRPAADVNESREVVVVAHEQNERRIALGRLFRRAGFEVRFAMTVGEVQQHGSDAQVVVASARLAMCCAAGESIRAWAQESTGEAVWVVSARRSELEQVRQHVGSGSLQVALHDESQAAANVLFIANALRRNEHLDQRQGARMLYQTSVSFRAAGTREARVGFCYNVSAGGLFVRTLAPPMIGQRLWVELTPPGQDDLVHLEGVVVWTRSTGNEAVAVAPPGFGLRISGGSEEALTRFAEASQAYAREQMPLQHP